MLNKAFIHGRVVKDIELKQTNTGKTVASFCVAVGRQGKDAGTDWIDCVAWEKKAEFVERWFKKGSPIIIEGRLQSRTYKDLHQHDRKIIELVVDEVNFSESKGSANTSADDISITVSEGPSLSTAQGEQTSIINEFHEIEVNDEDLPF